MSNEKYPPPILRNSEICGVEKLMLDHIAHLFEGCRSPIEVGPAITDEQTGDILDYDKFGLAPLNSSQKRREAVPLVLIGLSLSTDAEWLAGGPCDEDRGGRKQEIDSDAS